MQVAGKSIDHIGVAVHGLFAEVPAAHQVHGVGVVEHLAEGDGGLAVVGEVVIVLTAVAALERGAQEVGVLGRLEGLVLGDRLAQTQTATQLEGVPEPPDEAEVVAQRHLVGVVLVDDIVEIQGVVDGVASHVGRLEQRGDRAVVVVLQIVGVGLCEGRKLHRLVVRVGDVDVEVIAEDERLGAVGELDVAAHGRAVRALHHTVVIAVRQTDAVDH